MRENPYKRLPPIERRQDGSLYRMTPAQRKQANALIRRECCCYEDGKMCIRDSHLAVQRQIQGCRKMPNPSFI